MVIYERSCASFLSTAAVHQRALGKKCYYSLASRATLNEFYFDKLLSGFASEEEAIELVNQLKKMMKIEGFYLKK